MVAECYEVYNIIMLYSFYQEWFDWNKYGSMRNTLDARTVTIMDAIKNSESLQADQPSEWDLKLLRDGYGKL